MIAAVDEFIIYDDMQYTRRDWRNRNLIKTPQGRQWLTIPVKVKGKYHQTIRETEIKGAQSGNRSLEGSFAELTAVQPASTRLQTGLRRCIWLSHKSFFPNLIVASSKQYVFISV